MFVCAYVAINEGNIMIKCMFVCTCETLLSDVMLWRCRLEHLGVDVLQQVSSWWGREEVWSRRGLERCRLEHLGVDVLQQVSSWWGREEVWSGR